MNFQAMGDNAVLAELGLRVRKERLNQNMAQNDLAIKSGISRRTLQHLETGHTCTLANLIRVLRTIQKLDALDLFLPQPEVSPLQLAKLKGAERQRATGQRGGSQSRKA